MARPAAVLDILVNAQTGKASAELKKFDRNLKTTAKSMDDTDRSTVAANKNTRGFSSSLANANQRVLGLKNAIGLVKFPAFIAGAGAAAQAVSALGAGAVGLTSALAPLSGLLAAYPALLGAIGQAAGVKALAGFDDLGSAVGGLNEKLDETSTEFKQLSPQAQKFARSLNQAKGPMRDLQTSVQRPLFEGLNEGMDATMKNFGSLRRVMRSTAEVMGDLAREAGEFVGRKGFGRDFEKIGAANAELLGRMGRAGLNFADALRHVMVAARPLIDFLGKGLVHFSEWAEGAARAGRESGRMAGFFERTEKVVRQLVSIGGSLASAFRDIGAAARPLGEDILQTLVDQARKLSEWTSSNQGTLKDYFEDARGPLEQTGKLVKDLGAGFFDLAGTSGLGQFIKQIRQELLPAILDMTKATTKEFGPVLIDTLVELTKLLSNFMGSNGVLTGFVKLIGTAAHTLTDLFESIPGLASAASAALTGFSIFKLLGLGKLTGGAAAGGGIMSTIGTQLGTRFGTTFTGAAGPIIAGGIASVIAGIQVGKKLDIGQTQVSGLFLEQFKSGEIGAKHFIRALEDTDQAIDKHVIRAMVKAGDITLEQAGVMIRALGDVNEKIRQGEQREARSLGFGFAARLAKDGKLLKGEIRGVLDQLAALKPKARALAIDSMQTWVRQLESTGQLGSKAADRLVSALRRRFGEIPDDAKKKAKVTHEEWFKAFDRMQRDGDRKMGQFASNAEGHFNSLSRAVGEGLQNIGANVGKAMKSFGVKWKGYGIDLQTGNPRGIERQRGGVIVPGYGSGDKVPAMLEPGEVVLNRKAVAAMGGAERANKINRDIPRFAKGGVAGQLAFAYGPYDVPPIQYDELHAGSNSHWHISGSPPSWVVAIGKQLQSMGFMVGEHPAFGGVNADHGNYGPTDHYHGGAIDVNSAANETLAETKRVAAILGGSGVAGAVAGVAAAFEKIKRVVLEGPEGPLLDMGQAALDKTRSAANKFLAKQAPTETAGASAGISANGDVAKVFAATARKLSDSKKATLALFEAGVTESGMRDLAYGDSTSQGSLQLLASTASSMGIDPHDEGAVASAFLLRGYWGKGGANSLAAQNPGWTAGMVAQNVQGSAFPERYDENEAQALAIMRSVGLKKGGIIQALQEGGIAGGKGLIPDFRHAVRAVGQEGDPGTEALDRLMKKIRKIRPSKYVADEALAGRLGELEQEALLYQGNAARAAEVNAENNPFSLVKTGGKWNILFGDDESVIGSFTTEAAAVARYAELVKPLLGKFRGNTEEGWTTEELKTWWKLRRLLIKAKDRIAERKEQLEGPKGLIRKANDMYRDMTREVNDIERELGKKGKTPQGWKGIDPVTASAEEWNKQSSKKRRDLKREFRRKGGKLPGDRAWDGDRLITRESHPDKFPDPARPKRIAAALNTEITPGLEDALSAYNAGKSTVLGALTDVQGPGTTMKWIDKLPALGDPNEMGGFIRDAQIALKALGAKPDISVVDEELPDTSESEAILRQMLTEANQRTAVSQAQYGVFAGMPVLGAFAKGGAVGRGGMYLVGEHGPEVVGLQQGAQVYSNQQSQAMIDPSATVIVNGDIINTPPGMPPVEVVDAKAVVRAGSRGYGKRVLPGARGR